MDFFSIGSLSKFVKTQDMQAKWKQKKSSGDFKADGISTMSRAMSKRESDIKQAVDIYKNHNENKDDKLTSIYNKINSGSELTYEEMQYLKEKSPATYQQLKLSKLEKEELEREMKQCKTKEDVERLKMQHVNAAVAQIKRVENNPNISDGDKLAMACTIQKKLNDIAKVSEKFIKSGDYAKLPTDAEAEKARKDMEKAEENELRNISDKENTAEKSENNSNNNEQSADIADGDKKIDIAINSIDEKDKEITRTDAETSDEARKTKRSKIKSAYADAAETEKSAAMPFAQSNILSIKG